MNTLYLTSSVGMVKNSGIFGSARAINDDKAFLGDHCASKGFRVIRSDCEPPMKAEAKFQMEVSPRSAASSGSLKTLSIRLNEIWRAFRPSMSETLKSLSARL